MRDFKNKMVAIKFQANALLIKKIPVFCHLPVNVNSSFTLWICMLSSYTIHLQFFKVKIIVKFNHCMM